MTTTAMQESKGAAGSVWVAALIFLPLALLLFTVFVILPIGEAAWYSVYNWDGYNRPQNFIGLKNYVSLFNNASFRTAILNNLLIIAISLTIQLPLALAMALLLARRAFGAVAFRLIFFLPYILAEVACGLIWRFMFDGDYGLVSIISQSLGGKPYFLLTDPHWAFAGVLVALLLHQQSREYQKVWYH